MSDLVLITRTQWYRESVSDFIIMQWSNDLCPTFELQKVSILFSTYGQPEGRSLLWGCFCPYTILSVIFLFSHRLRGMSKLVKSIHIKNFLRKLFQGVRRAKIQLQAVCVLTVIECPHAHRCMDLGEFSMN